MHDLVDGVRGALDGDLATRQRRLVAREYDTLVAGLCRKKMRLKFRSFFFAVLPTAEFKSKNVAEFSHKRAQVEAVSYVR